MVRHTVDGHLTDWWSAYGIKRLRHRSLFLWVSKPAQPGGTFLRCELPAFTTTSWLQHVDKMCKTLYSNSSPKSVASGQNYLPILKGCIYFIRLYRGYIRNVQREVIVIYSVATWVVVIFLFVLFSFLLFFRDFFSFFLILLVAAAVKRFLTQTCPAESTQGCQITFLPLNWLMEVARFVPLRLSLPRGGGMGREGKRRGRAMWGGLSVQDMPQSSPSRSVLSCFARREEVFQSVAGCVSITPTHPPQPPLHPSLSPSLLKNLNRTGPHAHFRLGHGGRVLPLILLLVFIFVCLGFFFFFLKTKIFRCWNCIYRYIC